METLIGGLVSFLLLHFTTHPSSKINKKLSNISPKKRTIKRMEIFPRLNIEAKNRRIHIHHWMILTPLFIASQTIGKGFMQSDLLHGFMLGGIFQGLMYKDSLKFIHHNKDYKEKILSTSYHRIPFLTRKKQSN